MSSLQTSNSFRCAVGHLVEQEYCSTAQSPCARRANISLSEWRPHRGVSVQQAQQQPNINNASHVTKEGQHSLRSAVQPPMPSQPLCMLHVCCRLAPQPQHCTLCCHTAPPGRMAQLQAATAMQAMTRPTPPPPAGCARAPHAQHSCSVLAWRRSLNESRFGNAALLSLL